MAWASIEEIESVVAGDTAPKAFLRTVDRHADGVAAGDRLLLMMRNRPDFHWFDTAAQFLRATPVSIYNSSSPEEIAYLAGHAEAEVAVVEDMGFAEKI